MGRPIPVFSFVFAAYAATCAGMAAGLKSGGVEERRGDDPFLAAWRTRGAHGGKVLAKLGLLSDDAAPPTLATRASGESCEEIWIGEIVETRLGFIGVVQADDRLPPRVAVGQRLRFHLINVLDWRSETPEQPKAEPRINSAKPHPHRMLAQLYETVSK